MTDAIADVDIGRHQDGQALIGSYEVLEIKPHPKPRMTRYSARFSKRAMAYWNWKNSLKAAYPEFRMPLHCRIYFVLEMPKSWTKKKRKERLGEGHTSVPDADNLIKALYDAVEQRDEGFWHMHAVKIWGEEGRIIIEKTTPPVIKPWFYQSLEGESYVSEG